MNTIIGKELYEKEVYHIKDINLLSVRAGNVLVVNMRVNPSRRDYYEIVRIDGLRENGRLYVVMRRFNPASGYIHEKFTHDMRPDDPHGIIRLTPYSDISEVKL